MAQTDQLLIRLDPALKRLVTDIAVNEDRSIAWIVRKALHDFCAARPEALQAASTFEDPSAPPKPTYKRPPGRPAKRDPQWLDEYEADPIRTFLDGDLRERATQDEVLESVYKKPASELSLGHHARAGHIMRALGWIELVERHPDGSEGTFWFRNMPS